MLATNVILFSMAVEMNDARTFYRKHTTPIFGNVHMPGVLATVRASLKTYNVCANSTLVSLNENSILFWS